MEIIIRKTAEECAEFAAKIVENYLRINQRPVLGLATGSTPLRLYKILIQKNKEQAISFKKCVTFNLDEYVGLTSDHAQAYRHYMDTELFQHTDIQIENTHVPDGMAEDLRQECQRYETAIRNSGGIGLQILGIGSNAHIGFNEPMCSLSSRTWVKILSRETIRANARFFNSPEEVPKHCITMGIGTIMEAKHCIVLATGESKADAVVNMIEGPISANCPASILQMHPRTTIIVDEDAAKRLQNKSHYTWVEQNKLDWQQY
jgi:glucosamine-6-phosphate deaminase